MRSRDRGAVALAAAGVLARVLLAILGWTESASERLELASPVDALARIREGHALWGTVSYTHLTLPTKRIV